MDRKNLAMTVTTMLCALLFIVIGSCFSAFVYKKEIIKVENPAILIAQGIQVFSGDGDKVIDKLELSKMKLGLKPATGEEDSETNIPTTVTDTQGSEGQYAKFKLYAPSGAKIYITNVNIENEKEEESIINAEKENIMVSIKEILDSTKSLVGEKIELGSVSANDERMEYTFMIWLSGKVSEKLESSTIFFDISFEVLD